MATENKAVTSYLPDDVHLALIEYCTSKGLIRKDKNGKDKPSLGTAIVEILGDYFQVISLEQSDLSQKLEECFKDRVMDLVHDLVLQEFEKISQSQTQVNNTVQDEAIDLVQHTTNNLPGLEIDVIQEILLDTKILAIRLSVSPSSISNNKTKLPKSDFLQWLKEKDPDRLAWNFKRKIPGNGVHYFPVTEYLTEELRNQLLKLINKNL